MEVNHGYQDAQLRIFNIKHWKQVWAKSHAHKKWIRTLAWRVPLSRDPRSVIATGGDDRRIRVWLVDEFGKAKCDRILRGHTERMRVVVFPENTENKEEAKPGVHLGALMFSGGAGRESMLWDMENDYQMVFRGDLKQEWVMGARFTHHGRLLATAGYAIVKGKWKLRCRWDSTVKVWDVQRLVEHGLPLTHPASALRWEFATGVGYMSGVAWIRHEEELLGSSAIAHLFPLRAEDGEPSGDPWMGHSGEINHIVARKDIIATASDDNRARLWNAYTGDILAVYRGHMGLARCTDISRCGQWVVTASNDSNVRIYFACHPSRSCPVSPLQCLVCHKLVDLGKNAWSTLPRLLQELVAVHAFRRQIPGDADPSEDEGRVLWTVTAAHIIDADFVSESSENEEEEEEGLSS